MNKVYIGLVLIGKNFMILFYSGIKVVISFIYFNVWVNFNEGKNVVIFFIKFVL